MKAIRKDDVIDSIHSLYVEQWDWEMVIDREDRTIKFLKDIVKKIYASIKETSKYVRKKYGLQLLDLPKDITFITSQELEDEYPDYSPEEREEIITREKGAVFIIGIGDQLVSGIKHGDRSPDYDDWSLDGDLIIFDPVIDKAIEISSMGIRVDEKTLKEQLKKSKCMDRIKLPYHKKIMSKEFPYTIGGGIGQSRILMLLLEKNHIAEVQASSWDKKTLKDIKDFTVL